MGSLSSGVLLKLFREIVVEEKQSEGCREPILLQIRSIIPLLSEADDLWPNQGFFLKVSDSSHAIYVSLPREQDNMVLCNELQLGQFIYVKTLEAGYPVPILKGIKPVAGRHPCYGEPEDLISIDNLESFCGVPEIKMIAEEYNDEKKKQRETIRSVSASKASPNPKKGRRSSSCTREGDEKEKARKNRTNDVDNESVSETNTSTVSSGSATRRRSWNGEALAKIAEVSNSESIVTKHEIKPIGRSTSAAAVPPIRPYKSESSDENSISRARKKDNRNAKKSNKSLNQTRTSLSRKCSAESLNPAAKPGSLNDKKWTETEIQWDSLPSNLAKLGKEVLRQRDIALLAAVDILQEASAAERLLKCLSAYSELQSATGNDMQPSVDNFFNLHKDLAQTRLIFQSLISISPLRETDVDSNDHSSIKEMLKIGLDGKKNATSWIKAALASDLFPVPAPAKTKKATSEATSTEKISNKSSPVGKKRVHA